MGFLKSLIGGAIEDGVRKAVGEATEKALAPMAERLTNRAASEAAAAESIVTEAIEASDSKILLKFPEWTFSEIEDVSTDETDEYILERITVRLTDAAVEAYQRVLKANGFEGDCQILRRTVGGREQLVDFTFVPDSEIQYLIKK